MNVFDLFNCSDIQIDDSCQTEDWRQGIEDTNWDVVEWIVIDHNEFFKQHTCEIVSMSCSECSDCWSGVIEAYCPVCGTKIDWTE